jgi:hypothetical protein
VVRDATSANIGLKKKQKKLKKLIDGLEQVCYNVCLFRTGRGCEKKAAVEKKVVDGRNWLGYSAESVATKKQNAVRQQTWSLKTK